MRAPVRQEVLFELGRACEAKGDDDKALATWRELAKSYPNGRYLVGGGSWLVLALLGRNDPGGALRAVDEMTGDARGANADAAQVAALDLLRGRALAGSTRCLEALADLETNKDRKAALADRASKRQEEMKRLFPTSRLLSK